MVSEDAKGRDTERDGLFAGDDPFAIIERWLEEAWKAEPRDANAISVATCDANGLPDVRTVLLKEIEGEDAAPQPGGGLVFYTNRESAKGQELAAVQGAAGLLFWKSLGRQIRFRGPVEQVSDAQSDAYFASRHPQSRAGAIASKQSRPLDSRQTLIDETDAVTARTGADPKRPPNWGGYRIRPIELEFWAEGEHRLHDRFIWRRDTPESTQWRVTRLYP